MTKRKFNNSSSALFKTPTKARKPNPAEVFVAAFADREGRNPGSLATVAKILGGNEAHRPIIQNYTVRVESEMRNRAEKVRQAPTHPMGPK